MGLVLPEAARSVMPREAGKSLSECSPMLGSDKQCGMGGANRGNGAPVGWAVLVV